MKHYLFFKYGRLYFMKVYELWGDYESAKDFRSGLSKQYGCPIILCEVK